MKDIVSALAGALLVLSATTVQACATSEGHSMTLEAQAEKACQALAQVVAGEKALVTDCKEVLPSLYRILAQVDGGPATLYRVLADQEGKPAKGLKALAQYAEQQSLNAEALTAFSVGELLQATEAAPPGFHPLDAGKVLDGETPLFQTKPFKLVLLTLGPVPPIGVVPSGTPGGAPIPPPPGGGPGGAAPPTLHRATFEKDAQGWGWKIERRDPFTRAWSERGVVRP